MAYLPAGGRPTLLALAPARIIDGIKLWRAKRRHRATMCALLRMDDVQLADLGIEHVDVMDALICGASLERRRNDRVRDTR